MYALGIDLGTTYTAAAVWRGGRAEICALGTRSAAVPSVVLVRADGSVLTGEPATRRALAEPDRVAREFKRRLGDSTPVLLGGSPFSAEALTARLLSAVYKAVTDREGGRPGAVCISHPANWGPFKTDLLRQAVTFADLGVPVGYTTEPEAAAISYARQERLAPGETIAVYDLGGGTFDAAVLRRTGTGFELLGQPEGIERLGGIDIDAAVFAHVARTVGDPLTELDEDDPAAIAAVARLRTECTEAKEALSSDTDTTIPVLLPTYNGEVRLTRAELESMVRPPLYDSIEALKRALRSAGVTVDDLSAVLLVGGSSRMPLVAQLVGAELGRPVAVDAHPKHAIALGAAWLASGNALPSEPAPATRVVRVERQSDMSQPGPGNLGSPGSGYPGSGYPGSGTSSPAVPGAGGGRPAPGGRSAQQGGNGSMPNSRPNQAMPNPYPPIPPAAASPSPPLGTYPTIPPGYRTSPMPQGRPFATPMPGAPGAPSLHGVAAAERRGRTSRWLVPVIAAMITLVAVAAIAYWLVDRGGASPAPGGLGPLTQASSWSILPPGTSSISSISSAASISSARHDSATSSTVGGGGGGPGVPVRTAARTAAARNTGGGGGTSGAPATTTAVVTTAKSSIATSLSSSSAGGGSSTPGAVGWTKLYNATQDTLDVDWGLAAGATRYQLSWVESGADGRSWNGVPPAYTDYKKGPETLINLRPGRTYTVTVTPFNGKVEGPTGSATGKTLA